jgi:signal transduction histidine kinase
MNHLIWAAREIKAGDLRQRVPVPRAYDEVRALALTLNEMIERLEQSFQRQRRFVADASHELRTPVAVIRSKTDLALLQIVSPEHYLNVFHAIHTEAERLGHLISNLLALARADEGQVHLEREPVRFDQLVEAVAAATEVLATERQVSVQVQASEPLTVWGDEARLMQVVMNLLENALLYTDAEGKVFLSVSAWQGQAMLVVRDTGIGIAPEHLPHLFERFYRVDAARTHTEGSNSGLGLSIVDWVVKAHGGSVSVESQVGLGSTFTVMLPRRDTP